MTVLTEKTVFLHIGRTGGHWVSHVLWSSGLTVKRLRPLHLRPSELASNELAQQRQFWFCFVRHPLQWIKSVWVHSMSFGLGDPTLGEAFIDHFPTFLERLLAQHANGIVTERLSEYVDAATFVGRTENLAQDLIKSLELAGEPFDTKYTDIKPINASVIPQLLLSAKAPRSLLEKVMTQDQEFAERFGYEGVPVDMVADYEPRSFAFPRLRWNNDAIEETEFQRASFDFPLYLPNGRFVAGRTGRVRELWAICSGLNAVQNREEKNLLFLPAGDGVGPHLAASFGFKCVDALDCDRTQSFDLISRNSANKITWNAADVFPYGERRFDVVFCNDFAISRAPHLSLSILASVVREGGELLISSVLIESSIHLPLTITFVSDVAPHGPLIIQYLTRDVLRSMLTISGFCEIEFVEEYPTGYNLDECDWTIADKLGVDPDLLFSSVVVKAIYRPHDGGDQGHTPSALEDHWLRRRVLWMADPDNADADAPVRRLLSRLQQKEDQREAVLAGLRGEAADRRRELIHARSELIERSAQSEELLRQLAERTNELVRTREELVVRAGQSEELLRQLSDRTEELVRIRQELATRTADLETFLRHLPDRI